jgi:hypothetical protein
MKSRLGASFWFDLSGYRKLLSNCDVKNLFVVAFFVVSKIMLLSKSNLAHDREIQ